MNPFTALLSRIPYLRYAVFYRRNCQHRPGHFYSPVVNLKELQDREAAIWKEKTLPGIDLKGDSQRAFLKIIAEYAPDFPPGGRYYPDNQTYGYADGLVLFTMLRHFKPKRVIEVGSGFSSALMLDTSDKYNLNSWFTLIEPNPWMALNQLLKTEDWLYVLQVPVQDVRRSLFQELQANDILFIDGSHVSKTGSDVTYLLTEIFPTLNKGVIIHIHDIFYPFEYPKEWLFTHRLNWNEIYAVHQFLLFNDSFEILFFSDYMQQTAKADIPLFFKDRPGSLWLRKRR